MPLGEVTNLLLMGGSEIELTQKDSALEKEKIAHRLGWTFMAMTLAAGLAGLLGPGPLSHAKISRGNVELHYNKFGRKQCPMELKLFINGAGSNLTVAINQPFLDQVEMKLIEPEPELASLDAGQTIFKFKQESPGTHLIKFNYEPRSFGKQKIKIEVNRGEELEINQFNWP